MLSSCSEEQFQSNLEKFDQFAVEAGGVSIPKDVTRYIDAELKLRDKNMRAFGLLSMALPSEIYHTFNTHLCKRFIYVTLVYELKFAEVELDNADMFEAKGMQETKPVSKPVGVALVAPVMETMPEPMAYVQAQVPIPHVAQSPCARCVFIPPVAQSPWAEVRKSSLY
ncbi:hypothetical protein L1987_12360 [Smallanthus sonchifolius]|uniref:Uncharacterized protein n=1 Tax=Smallanthus sonchifolius TaxID=185202 RepID=A0ACB9JE47_9ASTR|nr:hypothetical protein L1987_12360 [Smallanthus sonchifolius]